MSDEEQKFSRIAALLDKSENGFYTDLSSLTADVGEMKRLLGWCHRAMSGAAQPTAGDVKRAWYAPQLLAGIRALLGAGANAIDLTA